MSKTEQLFVYGTLLEKTVQLKVIGRVVCGIPDTLVGYIKKDKQFHDGNFPVIHPDQSRSVDGLLLELSSEELFKCDQYEGAEYCRFKVMLKSGISAWVYSDEAW